MHRLHPVAYFNDCIKQLPNDYVIDKKFENMAAVEHKRWNPVTFFRSRSNKQILVPSIDLTKAVVRQRKLLEKFQYHELSRQQSMSFYYNDSPWFEPSIQKYVSFLKLARKDTRIVPTFEIDLIWHTHMRYPLRYREVTLALCGFLLDHDDSIDTQTLKDAYQKTAARWKIIYNSEYGQNIDEKYVSRSRFPSSCAMIPIIEGTSSCDGG